VPGLQIEDLHRQPVVRELSGDERQQIDLRYGDLREHLLSSVEKSSAFDRLSDDEEHIQIVARRGTAIGVDERTFAATEAPSEDDRDETTAETSL